MRIHKKTLVKTFHFLRHTNTVSLLVLVDGEICAWNHQLSTFSQQSQYKSIRGLRPGHPVFQQCLVIYDICYLNGRVLTNLPLKAVLRIRDPVLFYPPDPGWSNGRIRDPG
jgi:hypothetical protein